MGGEVILFVGSEEGLQRNLMDDAVHVRLADPPIPFGLNSPTALGRWAGSCIALQRLDAVLLPGNSYFRAARPLSIATGHGVPLFVTISNVLWRPDRSLPGNLLFSLLTRWRLRGITRAIAMSSSLSFEARRALAHRTAVAVAPNALFESLPDAQPGTRRHWHLCAVGRLVPQKNFSLVLRSLALLRDLPVTLSIVGDGVQMRELRQLASSLGILNLVTFVGEVADARPYLAQAEVMMLTSAYEGYPAVVVEALAAGTFVVTSDCSPVIPELLHTPDLGTIVTSGLPADFARAIRRFFAGLERNQQVKRRNIAQTMVLPHVCTNAARRYLDVMGLAPPAGYRSGRQRMVKPRLSTNGSQFL